MVLPELVPCINVLKASAPRPGWQDGGGGRDRTDDLRLAKPSLSQLSYAPFWGCVARYKVVGLARLELATLRLSGVRSNHLSYRPQS